VLAPRGGTLVKAIGAELMAIMRAIHIYQEA